MPLSQEVEALLLRHPEAPYVAWVAAIANTSSQTPRLPGLPYSLAIAPPNTTVEVRGACVRGCACVRACVRGWVSGWAVCVGKGRGE